VRRNLNFYFLLFILSDRSVEAQVGSRYVLRSFAKVANGGEKFF
jgi:hypothetical protein